MCGKFAGCVLVQHVVKTRVLNESIGEGEAGTGFGCALNIYTDYDSRTLRIKRQSKARYRCFPATTHLGVERSRHSTEI